MCDNQHTATVEKVIANGKHGGYIVCSSSQLEGSITLSLSLNAWIESEPPQQGSIVVLIGIFKKRAGWRASKGRLFRPSDESSIQKGVSK